MNREKIAINVSIVSIISNIFLTIIKFIIGFISNSKALISDAVHSLSDVLSTFVVIVGVKLSCKEPDKDHPYGHERLECVASIILSVMLFLTGMGIGITGIQSIIKNNKPVIISSSLALICAFISIVVKEIMYWYTKINAKKINSGALLADAYHHHSDSLSSVGSFIGIVGVKLGFPVFDTIASIVISLFIIKAAIEIFKDEIDKMIDKSCDDDTIYRIKKVIYKNKSVKNIDDLKTRQFGNRYYVDVEIAVDKNMNVSDAHDVAHSVHDMIEENFKNVKHCMVHINPYDEENK